MSEHERAEGQTAATGHAGGSPADAGREAVAREIGERLAQGRKDQRFSLDDVSARLKVASHKLAAIEQGDVAALPDVTFAKGVMRAYARMLQIDIDALLARFHAQAVPVVEIGMRREGGLNESFDDRNRFGSGGSGGRWIWLALVVAGIGGGALFGLDHFKQWIEARKETLTAPAVTQATVQGAEPGTVTAALPPVMASSDAPAPSEALPASGPAAVEAVAPAASAAPAVAAAPVPATMAASVPVPVAAAGTGELRIRFASDTWYEIRDRSGKVVLGGTARAGQDLSGGGTPPYKIVIGNVKGVESLTRNGTPVDLRAANRNNVARLTLP
ncbi:helix-hairpin-helix DNA-binding motif-containing protein [Cupriavidus basilensis OR16]|uniref:Helix-hairpin-helix DNA-binding motif-containing protein n=1 Tax=Cupriavidus basilensis OR16 TaxID=1127483 RepID=H1S2W7_9BURK|nr:RodZ domain-containing protein [Cupriavidus basilensis]EHP43182.1 helix-hairpin-helix DNA-binding motif-containing protein [Cupriavidus basilensis OR16]